MTVFPRVLALLAERRRRRHPRGGRRRDPGRGRRDAHGGSASRRSCCRTRRPTRSSPPCAASSPSGGRARRRMAPMESWTFPPRYDADYRPPAGSRYWFPVRETMPAAERDRAILGRLQALTRYAWDHAPFYRRKWDEAGFHPDHLRTLEDFETKVPVITKRDLRDAQARLPPFGDYLCVAGRRSPSHPRHVGHDGPADELRDRPRRLGRDRQRACANSLGHGLAARRHGVHRGDLQPLHGLVGHARRRRAARARRPSRSAPARPG